MACPFTAPLRAVTAWVPCSTPIYAEEIDECILRWHSENGTPAPDWDSEMAAAVYEIPAGTDWSGWPEPPTRVRVVLPSRVVYLVSVEVDGGYGDDGSQFRQFFHVEARRG